MILTGIVQNGSVILESGAQVPNGTRVQVIVADSDPKPTLTSLLKYDGCMPDMPVDFAEQHDHYIHGTPKR